MFSSTSLSWSTWWVVLVKKCGLKFKKKKINRVLQWWRFPFAQVLSDADPSLQAMSEEEKNAYVDQGQIRFAFLGFLSLCKSFLTF